MKIGGHRLIEHIRLLAPLFGLIGAVWILRLILAAARTPPEIVRLVSVSTATTISIILAVLYFRSRRFGGYTNVFVASFMLNLWAELLIISAILFAMLTRTNNIYTSHEYFHGDAEPASLQHIYGHLTFGMGMGTLVGAAVGCILLWLLRVLIPEKEEPSLKQ
jgi:hypothetical protein